MSPGLRIYVFALCPQVFLVTGGYVGVGFELCKILYAHHATVCIAGRSDSKAQKAISSIEDASPKGNGRIEFIQLDLADLSTIKPAVASFAARHERLDVLVNNAGVSYVPSLRLPSSYLLIM